MEETAAVMKKNTHMLMEMGDLLAQMTADDWSASGFPAPGGCP
jgi:hypothetical protein